MTTPTRTDADEFLPLSPALQRFILHWGEMGTRWGINRSVAQIHALLYLSPRPLPAETIAETLSLARSNVSTGLHELQGWGIVKSVHVLGDRRDHFESMADVWEMFKVIVRERKRREVDPTLEVLRETVQSLRSTPQAGSVPAVRLAALLAFFESTTAWYAEVSALPTRALRTLVRSTARLKQLLRDRTPAAKGARDDGEHA